MSPERSDARLDARSDARPDVRGDVHADAHIDTRVVHTVCSHDCPDSCAWIVTVEDGRAVRMAGGPDHPFTNGFLCTKVATPGATA